MKYTFVITGYDEAGLLPQVSRALETRTQLLSRGKYPGLWKGIDRMNSSAETSKEGNARRKIRSVILLALGIFLFVPGLTAPRELLFPLVAGAAAIAVGIAGLWGSRKRKKDPFEKAARQLLAGKAMAPEGAGVEFSQEGMRIFHGEEEEIPYGDLEFFIEGEDIYLITFKGRVVLLQKQDLQGEEEAFRSFMEQYIPITRSK